MWNVGQEIVMAVFGYSNLQEVSYAGLWRFWSCDRSVYSAPLPVRVSAGREESGPAQNRAVRHGGLQTEPSGLRSAVQKVTLPWQVTMTPLFFSQVLRCAVLCKELICYQFWLWKHDQSQESAFFISPVYVDEMLWPHLFSLCVSSGSDVPPSIGRTSRGTIRVSKVFC